MELEKVDKLMKKIKKQLNEDMLQELDALSPEEIKNQVVQSQQAIKLAKDELDENPEFKKLKSDLKDLRSGFTDLKKFQQAKIDYLLLRLEESGK